MTCGWRHCVDQMSHFLKTATHKRPWEVLLEQRGLSETFPSIQAITTLLIERVEITGGEKYSTLNLKL